MAYKVIRTRGARVLAVSACSQVLLLIFTYLAAVLAPDWLRRVAGWPIRAPGWPRRVPGWPLRDPGWPLRVPGWPPRVPGWPHRAVICQNLSLRRATGPENEVKVF